MAGIGLAVEVLLHVVLVEMHVLPRGVMPAALAVGGMVVDDGALRSEDADALHGHEGHRRDGVLGLLLRDPVLHEIPRLRRLLAARLRDALRIPPIASPGTGPRVTHSSTWVAD